MEAEPAPRPTNIRVDRQNRRLIIAWSDGFRCEYPWTFLRANCPSAGERIAREQTDDDPLAVLSRVPSNEIADAKMVGNYALNLVWADGHSAGIYTWEYLRRLADQPEVATTALA